MSDGQIVIDTKIDSSGADEGARSLKSKAAKLASEYKKSGMDASSAWKKAWSEIERDTDTSVSSIKNKVESLSSGFSRLAKAIGVAFVVDKVKDFGHSILTAGVNFDAMKEQSIAAWTTVLGSASAANDMFNQITKFAASTPFSQLGVDQMAKQLSNAGFKGQALFDQLSKFGDMGSAFSVQEDSLKEMVRQYSQVKMAGVAYTEDLNILADRSIPIYTALADVLHTNVANVKKLASQGKITADIYDKAINKIAESTKGGMEKQSLTLNGLISTLKDNMSVLAGELSKPIFDKLKNTLSSFLPLFQKFVDSVGKDGLAQALSETFPQFSPLISVITGLGNILTNIVVPIIKEFFTFIGEHAFIIGLLATTVGGLLLAFKGFMIIKSIISALQILGAVFSIVEMATLSEAQAQTAANLAFLACPAFWVVAALIALVGAFIYLWNTSETFRSFWIGLWNGLKAIVNTCVSAILGFFKGLINFIKNDWKQILLFLVNPFAGAFALLYKHCEGFRKFIDNLVKSIVNFFKELPSKISTIFNSIIKILKQWGTNVWNFFTQTIPQWINFIGQWFAKLPSEIWKWLVNTYNKVVAWGNNMIQKAIAIGTEFINNIINWFSQLPSRIWTWLVDTYNKVATWGSNLVQKAIETASNFINNFINWISQLPEKFMSWLSQTINNVIAWGRNLANAGLNAGRELVNSIVNTVKAIPGHMLSIGTDIVRGIYQGIINAKDWLISKITGFAGSIVGGFKSALGIHSPARRLYSTGMYTIQGVQVGMENEMPNLNDQVEKQMTGMVGKMRATVKAQTSAQNFKASFGAMHMNMNKSFKLIGDNEKQPIVINLDEKHLLDGEVIAAHTTHKVIENISENQNNYAIATGGI